MTEGEQQRLGFSAVGGRAAKAEKIVAILAAAGCPLNPDDRVLDLGCGSGEIAAHLARLAHVTCADAVDQRVAGRDQPFIQVADGLPVAPAVFDVVLSNHVIEHVDDAAQHLREIRRVLRPGGAAYLATPNRLWPWEVHARVTLLHYLPTPLFDALARRLGRLHEPVRLLTLASLRRLAGDDFAIEVWHPRILHAPTRFALNVPPRVRRLLAWLPMSLLQATAALQPTLILVLRAR